MNHPVFTALTICDTVKTLCKCVCWLDEYAIKLKYAAGRLCVIIVYSGINIKVAFVDGKKYIGKYALKLRTVSAKSLLFYTHVENNKTYENRVVSVKHVFHSFLQILWETLFLCCKHIANWTGVCCYL